MKRLLIILALSGLTGLAFAQKIDLPTQTKGILPPTAVVTGTLNGSRCLHTNGAGTQITEAAQDCPLPNGVLTVSTTSGIDLGTQANALWATCGNSCTVFVPTGIWSYSQTIQMTAPGQSLVCEGSGQTFLNYTGSGDAIYWQMNPFSIKKAGTLKGCSIVGTSAAQNCVHSGSLEGSTWEDLTISGCTGASANGILLENALLGGIQGYTERTYMKNVHVGYSAQPSVIPGNATGMAFKVNGGTNSFGYGEYEVWLNVESGQTGILIDTSALVYHNVWNIQGNIDQVPSSALTVKGFSDQSVGAILMESVNGDHTNTIHVTSVGVFNNPGIHVMIGSGDVAGTGGNIPVTKDAGGYYDVNTVGAYPGITDIQGEPQLPKIETGYQAISGDGAIVVAETQGTAARAGDMSGILVLTWPNNTNRSHTMVLQVGCSQFETLSCSMNILTNNAYNGQAVFTNPVMKLTGLAPSNAQIQVTIGNRNGISQNVVAAWYGAPFSVTNNAAPKLFPGTSLGVGALATTGIVSDISGNYATPGLFSSGNKKFVTTDFTDANSAALQAITGLSFALPASTQFSFHCSLMYSQATNVAGDQFGVGVITTAPANANIFGQAYTNTGAAAPESVGVLNALTTTTPTAVVTFQPAVTGVLGASLDGTIETGAGASTFNLYVLNGTAADVIVVKRGSYCALY